MAGYRKVGDFFEEEMNRLKRREREIQEEVYRERMEDKKQSQMYDIDEIGSRSRRSGSRDSSLGSRSYDIAQELEEERGRKRQMAEELDIRERQIQKTSELLERQSKMLANLEANVLGPSQMSMPYLMGQCQTSMYNQLTTSVYQQSIHTDYQYSQQYPPMNPVPVLNTIVPPYYQYNQPNTTSDVCYNSTMVPPPVIGIVEEPACKKAKTETGVGATEINITDIDLERKNPDLKCAYEKCRKTGHEIAYCPLLKKRSLYATCFYCKVIGHRKEQCPKLVEKLGKSKGLVCFNCNTAGHHCRNCPGKMKSIKCYRCNSEEHRVQNCPQIKKSKKAEVTETVSIDEVDTVPDTSDTLNNITPSNLVSIACGNPLMKNSFTLAVAGSVTTKQSAKSEATKDKSSAKKCTGSSTKEKRSAVSIASNVNSQELTSSASVNVSCGSANSKNIVQNTSTKNINATSVSSNDAAKDASLKTNNPSKNICTVSSCVSNTNSVIAREQTVKSASAKPVQGQKDFDIAEEMEKFQNNPKHMISMGKYRRHIENLRKAEREKKKSAEQRQAAEKIVDSSSNKVPDKQENMSSSHYSNSNQSHSDIVTQNQHPMKDSTKEVEKPKLIGMTCDVCQFTSKIQSEINTHKLTPLHIKKCELCETGCKMCGRVKFKTFEEYTSHNTEKLHKALLQKKRQISNSKVAKIANKVAGVEYVVPVSGYFCKLCKKFYTEESFAKDDHCRSKEHHEKIGEVLGTKYETAIRAKFLELCKLMQKNIKSKRETARFFQVLARADFTNLKPLASAKSPVQNKPKSKEIPQTVTEDTDPSSDVSKESCVSDVLIESVKEVKGTDISDAGETGDCVSKIPKQSCNISSSENIEEINSDIVRNKSEDISKAGDTHVIYGSSAPVTENILMSLDASRSVSVSQGNKAFEDVAKDEDSKLDIDQRNNLEIKNFTPLKSLNVNFDQSSSQIISPNIQEHDRVLETGGSTLGSCVPKKMPKSPTVPVEKLESTDADMLLTDDEDDEILCGDCDSDIELSD
ncbi:hypothetical protein LOTGIDRAFT_159073 [Lottia gigantea]|uniref:CCHC-type domain-containing protein n=1 Tax=Lottia gigantea TaxID=225164 RepID=V4AMA2_LOTGI|nr:hypothetical protein LOTGIDRAFT_159073 [Lottia gigantea]ESO98277.1 hypothetical protein LOTGIDRAFT_159073 [Lottia gigantea]